MNIPTLPLDTNFLIASTNGTYVKYFTVPQAYKVVTTHAHEIPGWKILSRRIHARTPHIGGINGDFQS